MSAPTNVVLALLLLAATAVGAAQQDVLLGQATRESVRAHNRFAIETHQRAIRRKLAGSNIVLSPLSIRVALSMLLPGSLGETRAELDALINGSIERDLIGAIVGEVGAGKEVKLANSLWVQEGVRVEPTYRATLARDFAASVEELDLQGDREGACRRLNAWALKHTGGLVPGSWQPEAISPLLKLVMVNAFYFGAKWQEPFPKRASKPEAFWVGSSQRVEVRMMRLQADLNFVRDDAFDVVQLPYRGSQFSMLLFVPRTVGGLAALEGSLSVPKLAAIRSEMKKSKVRLSLPSFDIRSDLDVEAVLTDGASPRLFQRGSADLSPMTGDAETWLGGMVHEARIKVDEEGARVAAVTTGKVYYGPGPIVYRVLANRPFFYAVQENRTGALLVTGRLARPKGRSLTEAPFRVGAETGPEPSVPLPRPLGPAGPRPAGPSGPGGKRKESPKEGASLPVVPRSLSR